ncbi:hypothetical protein [Actinoplanes sp. NPDC051859]|uniref:hypothetical protein n=1 Tax=Actinoplanes sp. NPDC051859 TaxID=3363909 RepID=UPI00378D3E4D
MEKREHGTEREQDFRHLPPRVTPEEMILVQPVVQAKHDPTNGNTAEWDLRNGWAG